MQAVGTLEYSGSRFEGRMRCLSWKWCLWAPFFLCGVWVGFYWQAVEETNQGEMPYFQVSCSEVYLGKYLMVPLFVH